MTGLASSVGAQGVGLLAACDDAALLNFRLWPKQREILASIERGPRLHVLALGRRSGKTTMAALVGLWDALLRPELDLLVRPGERRHVVCVATSQRQAALFVAAAVSIVRASPLLGGMIESATDDQIIFRNGTALAAFPCSARAVRGWPISTLLLDEAAHFVDSEGNSALEPVWRATVPSTAQFREHSRVIVASTPAGQAGLFASLFAQASSGELPDSHAVHATTAEINPTIGGAFLASERARDPDGFASEYEARFVGGGASFLDPERIRDAVAERGELVPEQAVSWVAGLDPAFSSDPFGLALVGRDPADRGRLLLGLARAWKPARRKPQAFEERRDLEDAVLDEVAELCRRFGAKVVTDQYAAPAIVDRLRRSGLTVRTVPMTATSKTDAYVGLRARLYTGTLELYNHPDLLAELRRLRSRFTAGQAGVVNPRVGGSHGDLAQATAIAVYEHDRHAIASPLHTSSAMRAPRPRRVLPAHEVERILGYPAVTAAPPGSRGSGWLDRRKGWGR